MTYRVFARRPNGRRGESLASCLNVKEADLPRVLAGFRYEHPEADIYYQCADGKVIKYEEKDGGNSDVK